MSEAANTDSVKLPTATVRTLANWCDQLSGYFRAGSDTSDVLEEARRQLMWSTQLADLAGELREHLAEPGAGFPQLNIAGVYALAQRLLTDDSAPDADVLLAAILLELRR